MMMCARYATQNKTPQTQTYKSRTKCKACGKGTKRWLKKRRRKMSDAMTPYYWFDICLLLRDIHDIWWAAAWDDMQTYYATTLPRPFLFLRLFRWAWWLSYLRETCRKRCEREVWWVVYAAPDERRHVHAPRARGVALRWWNMPLPPPFIVTFITARASAAPCAAYHYRLIWWH